ncbi:MAG: oligosaccharide flippase family protein [Candidatus Aminicenantes bacterium]|nr:MAG: oligosaccharide flippase family protein [Candidatus Aminicenantes bacterium]
MLKRIIKTSFFSVGSRGILTLINLIIMYSVSHGLGEEKLGIYSISAFIYYLFSFLTSFELTTYFGKEVAHQRDRIGEVKKLVGEMGTTFLIGLGISVLLLFFLLLFYHKIDTPVLLISIISGVIFGIEKNLSGILLGKEKMQFEFISQAAAFAVVAVPVFFWVKKLDITGIYFLRIAASVLTALMRAYFVRIKKYIEIVYINLKCYNWKEIKFFSASGFSYFIQHHFDLFILSFLISKELEGAYFLALRIYLAFCLLAEMTSFALTPYISRVYRKKESGELNDFHGFYKKILLVGILVGALASVILFFTRDILVDFFTKENPQLSSDFLFYFSFFIFFRFVSYYTGSVLTATQYQNIRFYILFSSALLMIGLELLLGHFFSVMGIIYSRAAMELFIFIAYLIAIAKIRHQPLEANESVSQQPDDRWRKR